MKKYILLLASQKVKFFKNKKYLFLLAKFNNFNKNDIIYICEYKSTKHNINPNPKYNYCFNCAYKTWDIGKPIRKYCSPVILGKWKIIERYTNIISKKVNNIFKLKLIFLYDNPELLAFKNKINYKFINL